MIDNTTVKSPEISIIIPVYNGEKHIGKCLNSINGCKINITFEIIVVDDASTDGTESVIQKFPCRYIKIKKSGVAAARNAGIKNAKGDIIFFFDADVKLKKDTIDRFLAHFREDADAYLMQGRWDKISPVPTFSSRFLLLKYAYNFKELFKNKRRLEAANLETGCLAVRREVFEKIGLFDERYKFSGGEEHELGIRILERYKIFYYPDIFVEHAFGNIFNTLKKIYRRTVNFSMLSFKTENKNFMKLHRNSVPLQDKISVLIIFLLVCDLPLFFININTGFYIFIILLALYFLNVFNFFVYLRKEESTSFAIIGIASDFLIMIPRLLGALKASCMFYVLRQKEYKI